MAGTLLYPVWVAGPALVPQELADDYAADDPAIHPDPANADSPDVVGPVAAWEIAAEGRQHNPPPDASEYVRKLYEMAALLPSMSPSREAQLTIAIGPGGLAVLGTPEYDPRYTAGARVSLAAGPHRGDLAVRGPGGRGTGPADRRALKGLPADSPERLLALDGLGRRLRDRYCSRTTPRTCTRRSASPGT